MNDGRWMCVNIQYSIQKQTKINKRNGKTFFQTDYSKTCATSFHESIHARGTRHEATRFSYFYLMYSSRAFGIVFIKKKATFFIHFISILIGWIGFLAPFFFLHSDFDSFKTREPRKTIRKFTWMVKVVKYLFDGNLPFLSSSLWKSQNDRNGPNRESFNKYL